MKILDQYIIRNFLGTFLFVNLFLLSVSVVIDLSQRLQRIENHHGSVKEALIQYYPVWVLWLGNTFMPIGVFISVIFFTSRLTNNNEIIAISASGISFQRLTRPYLISAFFISLISFLLNHFVLPITNGIKNDFQYRYLISVKHKANLEGSQKVNVCITDGEYIFIDNFSKIKKSGNGFSYQKFKDKKLFYRLSAQRVQWNEIEKAYYIYNYKELYIKNTKDSFKTGKKLKVRISLTPQELLPEEYIAETMNTFELRRFIKKEKKRHSWCQSIS